MGAHSRGASAASKHEALAVVLRDILSKPEAKSLKSDILHAKEIIAKLRKKLAEMTEGEGGESES